MIYDKSFILFQVIAENLSEEEIIGLKEMFKSMDTDNSGTITFEELKAGLPKLGSKLSESEVRQLMEAVRLIFFSSWIMPKLCGASRRIGLHYFIIEVNAWRVKKI